MTPAARKKERHMDFDKFDMGLSRLCPRQQPIDIDRSAPKNLFSPMLRRGSEKHSGPSTTSRLGLTLPAMHGVGLPVNYLELPAKCEDSRSSQTPPTQRYELLAESPSNLLSHEISILSRQVIHALASPDGAIMPMCTANCHLNLEIR